MKGWINKCTKYVSLLFCVCKPYRMVEVRRDSRSSLHSHPHTHTHTLKQGQLQQVAQDGVQKYSVVLSFKSIKCKTLHKIIILSQVSILELSSDKTSIITFHFSVYLGSRTIIKQFKYEDISSFTVAYGLGIFQRTAMIC